MAKRNKKGGWTGKAAGSSAVKSGGGPQVEKNRSELKKYEEKTTPFVKLGRVVIFLLVCILAGSLIYQATPKNMAEYWGVKESREVISRAEITRYDASSERKTEVLTEQADIDAFCRILDETRMRRLWFADEESVPFTETIAVYVEGAEEPAFEVGLAENRVYFIGMPTYDWYLEAAEPLMEYLN